MNLFFTNLSLINKLQSPTIKPIKKMIERTLKLSLYIGINNGDFIIFKPKIVNYSNKVKFLLTPSKDKL